MRKILFATERVNANSAETFQFIGTYVRYDIELHAEDKLQYEHENTLCSSCCVHVHAYVCALCVCVCVCVYPCCRDTCKLVVIFRYFILNNAVSSQHCCAILCYASPVLHNSDFNSTLSMTQVS